MGHIAELAERAGLGYVPHVVIADIGIGSQVAPTANAAAFLNAKGIVINPKMLELTRASVHSRLTPELETVISHELSHLKDGVAHVITRQYILPVAAPIIGIIGLYLFDKANNKTPFQAEKSKDEHFKGLEQNLHKVADEEIEKIKNEKLEDGWYISPEWKARIVDSARYAMAAAIGLAGGAAFTRSGMLAAEYRADKMAVNLTGNPDIYKNMMVAMDRQFAELMKCGEANIKHLKKHGFEMTVSKKIKEFFAHEIFGPHPSFKERHSFIDRVVRNPHEPVPVSL